MRWTFRWTFLGPPLKPKSASQAVNFSFQSSKDRLKDRVRGSSASDNKYFGSGDDDLDYMPRMPDNFSNSMDFNDTEMTYGEFPNAITEDAA